MKTYWCCCFGRLWSDLNKYDSQINFLFLLNRFSWLQTVCSAAPAPCFTGVRSSLCVRACALHHALQLWDETGPGSWTVLRTGGGRSRSSHQTDTKTNKNFNKMTKQSCNHHRKCKHLTLFWDYFVICCSAFKQGIKNNLQLKILIKVIQLLVLSLLWEQQSFYLLSRRKSK